MLLLGYASSVEHKCYSLPAPRLPISSFLLCPLWFVKKWVFFEREGSKYLPWQVTVRFDFDNFEQRANSRGTAVEHMKRLKRTTAGLAFALLVLVTGCGKNQNLQPDAIFVLGGATERERFAAKFAAEHPELPIWVSSGSPKDYAQRVFAKAGIDKSRVHLDYQAVDTVTNFTSLVDKFQVKGFDSVYLITSDYHMRRARVIGEIVFGSKGLKIVPVPIPTGKPPEPREKCLRDGARAILWVTTGHTGASLAQKADIAQQPKLDSSMLLSACYR